MVEYIKNDILSSKNMNGYIAKYSEPCPSCGKSTLFVKSDLENSVTLECPICLETMHLPSNYIDKNKMSKIDGNS